MGNAVWDFPRKAKIDNNSAAVRKVKNVIWFNVIVHNFVVVDIGERKGRII